MAVGYMDPGVVKNFRDGQLVVKDSGSNTVTVTFAEGDFDFEIKKNVIVVRDRGVVDHFRPGDEEPLSVSFSARYIGLYGSSSSDPRLYEAVLNDNMGAGWASTTATTSDVYTTDVQMTITDIDSATEIITLDDFALQSLKFTEGDEGTMVNVTGICKGIVPTVTGSS